MTLPTAFWDSSALIPLCVLQPQTTHAQSLYKAHELIVWWATPVEILSRLTRLARMGEMNADRFLAGKQKASELAIEWSVVQPSSKIATQAAALLEMFPLRAADALQLAASMAACSQSPHGSVFITADQRLADAARFSGFSVEFLQG